MNVSAPTSVLRSAALAVAMRWTDRLIGFLSTLLLARLLAPDDLGIIAMVSLVVGLVDVMLDLGVNIALVQNRNATQAHYDSAWTLRILETCVAALVLCGVSEYAANYFADVRVQPVLLWMAAGMVFSGMQNIGIVTFQKEMRFGLDFRFMFAKRVVIFIVTIAAAWIHRDYWALVIATVVSRAIGTVISFAMHPMRPRLSLEKAGEIFAVSLWLLMRGIGNYLHLNLHRIYVGGGSSAAVLGGYSLADEISSMPNNELLSPLNRVLFPSFVRVKHDLEELRRIFLTAQGLQTMVAMPCSAGLAFVAPEAVAVLLGDKWLFAVPFVQQLSIANIIFSITTSCGYVMITLGHTRSSAVFVWIQVFLFVLIIALLAPGGDPMVIAWARVLSVMAAVPVSIYLLRKAIGNVSVGDIIGTISRPLLATGCMYLSLKGLDLVMQLAALPALLIKIATGVVVYSVATLLIWIAYGKPDGAETYALAKLSGLRRRTAAGTEG